MIEVIFAIIASIVTVFIMMRTPKLSIPKEFELVESEIEQWLQTPIIPSKGESLPTTGITGLEYSGFGKLPTTTVGQTSVTFAIALMQEQKNSDIA